MRAVIKQTVRRNIIKLVLLVYTYLVMINGTSIMHVSLNYVIIIVFLFFLTM